MRRRRGEDKQRRAIVGILREVIAARSHDEVRGDATLQKDLGMDSLALVAVVLRLQEELGVDPVSLADRAADIRTVDDLVGVVGELTGAMAEA